MIAIMNQYEPIASCLHKQEENTLSLLCRCLGCDINRYVSYVYSCRYLKEFNCRPSLLKLPSRVERTSCSTWPFDYFVLSPLILQAI